MQLTHYTSIFDYIKSQETMYQKPIPMNDAWDWSMTKHIKTAVLYTNSQLLTRKDEFTPVKNVTLPILNLQHRAEDIEVKDVQIYVNDNEKYYLSLLVKRYHDDVFAVENDLDTFFDELNVSRIDYGGGLSKQLNKPCPEVVPLQSIAFCDQTDMLSGPIGIKHFFSPDQLLEMEKVGWGKEENGATVTLDQLITLSREEKRDDRGGQLAQTPGRYIEVYEVHGNLPKRFADPSYEGNQYETRLFIVAFYQRKETADMQGVILYTALEPESPFKLTKRDPIHGRALGRGGVEEIEDPQVWVNYDEKRMLDMKDAAAKTILGAIGSNSSILATRNNVKDMDNLEVIDLGVDGDLKQIDTFPRNLKIFEQSEINWQTHAKDLGGAQDPIQGKEPASGTPFSSLAMQVQQGLGLHEYRRGQYAKHLEEIYTDWIIPHIVKKITQGSTFLSELSIEELQYVTDALITNEAHKKAKDMLMEGEVPTEEVINEFKDTLRETFKKKGNKHFIKILKGELKNTPLGVKVSVAGKSKNLSMSADKITSIFRFAFSNPQGFAQVMQIPGMAKAFNQLLEFSGLSPADFSGIEKLAAPPPAPTDQPAPTPVAA